MEELLDLINKFYEDNPDHAFIFLGTNRENVFGSGKGSGMSLMAAFAHEMRTSKEFNNLMKSMMGAYLSKNPNEKEEFIRGLDFIETSPSMN